MHTSKKSYRDFEELVRTIGCIITGSPHPQIHHVKGRTFKHNKILIGPWYILPLHYDLHNGSHPNAYHNSKHGFIAAYGHPRYLFKQVLDKIDYNLDQDIISAIMDCYV